ncbi:hypothetical protein [Cohnella hongkongensis]|uniref:Uncharacterized protein n=1 Tax=Cohnella hongkongensis TaxID=178337 RepID=A0ABV9FIH4_9BACL
MSSNDELAVPQEELVAAWRRTLPERLAPGDTAEVFPDGVDPRAFHVHIKTAGRQMMEFDFSVQYVDSREVDIRLKDVEKDGQTVDEQPERIQELIGDYRRHLHETAQALHHYTHS